MDEKLNLPDMNSKEGDWIWIVLIFLLLFGGFDGSDDTEKENRPD